MKQGSTLFLKAVLVVLGLSGLAFCAIALPAGISSDNTGLYRPILIGMYVPAIPFFIALFQTWKLLNYIDTNKAFSQASVLALKNIKYCALVFSALFIFGLPFIFNAADKDDAPGAIVIGLLLATAPLVIAVFAAVLQRLLQNAIEIKSENDLTV